MNTKQSITPKEFFQSLSGKKYPNEDEFELAVLQAFNKVSQWFPEKTFRDLIEYGKDNNWISRSGYEVVVSVPTSPEIFNNPVEPVSTQLHIKENLTPKLAENKAQVGIANLSYEEVYWLVDLNSSYDKMLRVNGLSKFGFDSLIERGLVEYVDIAKKEDFTVIDSEITNLSLQAIIALKEVDYDHATDCMNQINELRDIPREDFAYRFTERGKAFVELIGNPTNGLEKT